MMNEAHWMDDMDVRREGDKAARRVAAASGAPLKAVRTIRAANICEQYENAVAYEGIAPSKLTHWMRGWQKGYGTR
jgi:hypothetical protein